MLKIQANKRDISIKYVQINLVSGTLYENDGYIFIPTYLDTPSLSAGDVISFYRKDGENIEFSEDRVVMDSGIKLLEDSSIPECASVVRFSDIPLYATSATLEEIEIVPNMPRKFLRLVLRDKHNYIVNRDSVKVKAYVDCSFQDESGLSGLTNENVCPGDYVIYNDIFLYRLMDVRNGNIDIPSSRMENYETDVFVEYEGETVRFPVIIPCNLGGKDNTNEILIYGNDEILEEIALNPFKYTFYGNDGRFFTQMSSFDGVDGEYFYLRAKTGTSVRLRVGDMKLSLPIGQVFDASMSHMEAVAQYSEEILKNAVNKIVDYEKQQFIPVYGGKDIQKLLFKIHLRERDDDWNTHDSLGWVGVPYQDVDANSVEYMGFDDEDIYYQKKKVGMSFLRVSFYNNRDRRTQKLLYTAKIYLNSSDLYGQYVDNVAKESENPLSGIGIEFVCTHKYDYDHSTEGFYLHLFPSNLNTDGEGKIYAKFELSNAKYGKTIPLVLFKDGFREGYIVTGSSGSSVDMKALYEDLYSEVIIKKNEGLGRYEWEFLESDSEYGFVDFNVDGDNALTLHLVEPRVNGSYGSGTKRQQRSKDVYDEGEYDPSCQSDTPYCTSDIPACPSDGSGIIDTSIDMFFGLSRSKPYGYDIVDRNYNSDNAGYTIYIKNNKYRSVIMKFSRSPENLYMGYKFDGWGAYDGVSYHSTQTVSGSTRNVVIAFSENRSEDVHYYYVELRSPSGERVKTLTVRQWPLWGQIGLSTNPTRIDYKHNTKRVILTSGTEYSRLSVTSANDDFFTYSVDLHETQNWNGFNRYVYYINLNVSENESATQRSGWVKFAINNERYAVMDVIQSGNTNAGHSTDVDGYTYTIEASITPNYIQEVKEGRNTNYEIVATLYKTNNATGVREASNDWTKYGVGLYKYCEPSTYSSYGYRQVTMYEDSKTDNSTITYTENAPELKYVDSTNGYCFAAIVNGQIVTSGVFKVNYCDMLLKYTAACYLFNENEIIFNSETNSLTFNLSKCVSMSHTEYLSADGNDYEVTYRYNQSIGGDFGLEPGRYYAVYGTIYSSDHYIEGSIKLSYQGNELAINDDTNTPWNYEDIGDRVTVVENTGSRKYVLGYSQSMTVGMKWLCISEPITLTSGTFKLDISYVADTRNKKGTCNGGDTPETREYDVDFVGSLDKEGGEVEYDAYFTGSLDKVEDTPQTETYDVDFFGSLDKAVEEYDADFTGGLVKVPDPVTVNGNIDGIVFIDGDIVIGNIDGVFYNEQQ